jgi:tetratricopeptide (TPR) repeat protein
MGALADYEKAISLKANDATAYNNRGFLKFNMGDLVRAIEDYDKAIALKPNYYKAYINRAQCCRILAGKEQDTGKKAELISKAEADEQKAEALKKEDKK